MSNEMIQEESFIQTMLDNIVKQDIVNYQVEIERHLGVEHLKANELERRKVSPIFELVESG